MSTEGSGTRSTARTTTASLPGESLLGSAVIAEPVDLILTSPFGTRMTVRRRIEGGFADAVGYLRERTETECVVETRRGLVTIPLAEVTATRAVPPPPPRRASRFPPLISSTPPAR